MQRGNYPGTCTCLSSFAANDLTTGKVARAPGGHRGHDLVTVRQMDDPMPLGRHGAIPLNEILVRTSRSSGPGGQHANVTASRVEAIFEVAGSQSLTDKQKRRVIARTGPRVVAVAQDARSQARNRELALERLRARLTTALAVPRPRRATRPTQASVERRLQAKRRQAERKRSRRRPSGAE
jgi:ribosome-associated protein